MISMFIGRYVMGGVAILNGNGEGNRTFPLATIIFQD